MTRLRIEVTNEDTGEVIRSLILEHPDLDEAEMAQEAIDCIDEQLFKPYKLREASWRSR